jgi:hypothetical protein
MVIHDFDLIRIALAKFEANSPAIIDRHRPLTTPISPKLVQADAFQWTQIAK